MSHALILGGTSDLGRAIARRLAARGWSLTLAGRDAESLSRAARDLEVRHRAAVRTVPFDALSFDAHAALPGALSAPPDAVYCVFGYLGDPARARADAAERRRILDTNFTAAVLVLEILSEGMAARGSGLIVGISSVAGDRGRGSHPLYGCAKAGFSAYLDGLRGRLLGSGVHVVTVKPGPMKTRMTEGIRCPPGITPTADRAAAILLRGVDRRRCRVYVPGVWRWIMAFLRILPEPLFHRLRL